MAKLTLTDIQTQFQSTTELNNNFNSIITAFENTLSRDGSAPNQMETDLDLNSNNLLNVNSINGTDASVITDVGSALTEVQNWANYPEDSLVPEGDLVDDYSSLHHAAKASDSATEAKNWANHPEDSLVPEGDLVDDYSSLHHANKASASAGAASASEQNAEDWATKTNGIVEATDHSSKAYAIGGTGVTDTAGKGAAKEWATKAEDSTVDGTEYSAKHYAAKAAAEVASINLPIIGTGDAGKMLKVNDTENAYEFSVGIDDNATSTAITIDATQKTTFSEQVLAFAGTVASPGVSFAGDSNTGLYHIGADSFGVATNGTLSTKFNNDGSQEWGAWSATGASNGKLIGDTSLYLFRSSVDTTSAVNHQVFYNPNGAVASIGTNGTSLEILPATGPTVTTKFNSDGSQEWGTFSATGATAGRKQYQPSESQLMQSSTTSTLGKAHYELVNPNGTVGTIVTNASATAYNTSSDPRLKSAFTAVSEAEAFALVDAYTAPNVLGKFHFLSDDTKEVLGFNAHAVLDLPFGDSIATEGQGPRAAALGEEYDTGEVDENGDPIMGTVTPAGVDQSKPVPGMLIAMGHLVNKARKFDALSALLVTKGVLTQAEVDALQ